MITLEEVRVLNVVIHNVEAVCHDLPPESAIDGLLGLSFLQYCDMNAHFKSRRLEFQDP